ncbi:unannotated protein [freshwater metagenome]|uniref:Unannotated protein n=1 Tax=freshwater metagenome TaxID=449393 RepID=A0A6J6BNQ3_9ZZZZ
MRGPSAAQVSSAVAPVRSSAPTRGFSATTTAITVNARHTATTTKAARVAVSVSIPGKLGIVGHSVSDTRPCGAPVGKGTPRSAKYVTGFAMDSTSRGHSNASAGKSANIAVGVPVTARIMTTVTMTGARAGTDTHAIAPRIDAQPRARVVEPTIARAKRGNAMCASSAVMRPSEIAT